MRILIYLLVSSLRGVVSSLGKMRISIKVSIDAIWSVDIVV